MKIRVGSSILLTFLRAYDQYFSVIPRRQLPPTPPCDSNTLRSPDQLSPSGHHRLAAPPLLPSSSSSPTATSMASSSHQHHNSSTAGNSSNSTSNGGGSIAYAELRYDVPVPDYDAPAVPAPPVPPALPSHPSHSSKVSSSPLPAVDGIYDCPLPGVHPASMFQCKRTKPFFFFKN